jgi:hypothetical protein
MLFLDYSVNISPAKGILNEEISEFFYEFLGICKSLRINGWKFI